jgi:hypothetical protein
MSACLRGDDRPLGDGQSATDASALFIVFEGERPEDVSLVSAGALHGSQDNSVLQIGSSNTDGLE